MSKKKSKTSGEGNTPRITNSNHKTVGAARSLTVEIASRVADTAKQRSVREAIPPNHVARDSRPGPRYLSRLDGLVQECRSELDTVRAELADQYKSKPVRVLFQFDALITGEPRPGIYYNSSGTTDEDGDCINCELKCELRNTGNDTVRIQVPVGIAPCEAVRVLRKTAEWIESRPDLLESEWDHNLDLLESLQEHRS